MLNIKHNTVAVIDYSLRTVEGQLIDEAKEVAYLHGYGQLLVGMEMALEGKEVGSSFNKVITPEHAFGEKTNNPPIEVHRSEFGDSFEQLHEGLSISSRNEVGERTILFVQNISNDHVTLTLDHPLAGVHLLFNGEVTSIRAALEEELQKVMGIVEEAPQNQSSCACC